MRSAVGLLLRLEARRVADPLRHPRLGSWVAVLLPLALGVAALWLGAESFASAEDPGDASILLGVLVSGAIGFCAYPLLFRAADDALLRALAVPGQAVYWMRALRLAALALGIVVLVLVPFVSLGESLRIAVPCALAAAAVAWASALFALSGAADTVGSGRPPGLSSLAMGPDPALVAAGPLVWAPLAPLLAGTAAARFAAMDAVAPVLRAALIVSIAAIPALLGARRFARARPRFAPRATEMAYVPPAASGGAGLVIGRGLARLLPAGAGAVRARDAVVVARRFRWAGRLVAPVAVICVLALLRAGARPEVRGWVGAACALVLLLQAMAVIGVGRLERQGRRWLDRAAGLRLGDRLLGRWAAAFGLALGLVLPVAITWSLAVPDVRGWAWLAAGAGAAVVSASASLAAAGR